MLFREIENKGIDCRLFGYLIDSEEDNGCHNLIDIYFGAIGEGTVEMEIPVSKDHLNALNSVHGGIIATLIDSAMGMAMKSHNKVGVTTSLNVNYLKGAGRGDVLKAFGKVTRNGNKVVFCEARIENQRGDLLATRQGSFFVLGEFMGPYIEQLKAQQS